MTRVFKKCLIAAVVVIITACGCQVKSPFTEKKEEVKSPLQNAVEILVDQNSEKIALLSRKYGLDPVKTREIVIDYMEFKMSPSTDKDPQKRLRNQLNLLDGLSKKYEVSVDRVSSLILDYECVAAKL